MNFVQLIIEALESLSANRIRSALTMLGIIIGVAAVIAMMSIGAGAQNAITSEIAKMGTNLLYINSTMASAHPKPLTIADAQAMLGNKRLPHVINVAPVLNNDDTLAVPGKSFKTAITATTPNYFKLQNFEVAEGSLFTPAQMEDYEAVIVLGNQAAQKLFETTTGLIGKKIRLAGQIFRVQGVLKAKGGYSAWSEDRNAYVPITTAQLRLMRRNAPGQVDMIYLQASSSETAALTQKQVTQVLRSRHDIVDKDDFSIMSTQSMLKSASQIATIMTAFLGSIGGVSLLVGGIGIMNIMLVTVSERTREIGLRKAIGARKADIRLQFLVESSLLSLGGGAIGILLGWGISLLIGRVAAMMESTLNPAVTLNSILLATLFSAGVGVFFGIYPANRAANLQPVEALRSE